MITKELALALHVGQELWHSSMTNADGTPLRARVNGQCRQWKTRPNAWRLPMKYGLKDCFNIGPDQDQNPKYWSLPERWPIERHAI